MYILRFAKENNIFQTRIQNDPGINVTRAAFEPFFLHQKSINPKFKHQKDDR
jgi:hypothetical protein